LWFGTRLLTSLTTAIDECPSNIESTCGSYVISLRGLFVARGSTSSTFGFLGEIFPCNRDPAYSHFFWEGTPNRMTEQNA
jgi:hypothetical protein